MSALVSVFCLAYNHEDYIRRALDSMVCQETDFEYEIFVHDDASTDRTAEILSESGKGPRLLRDGKPV